MEYESVGKDVGYPRILQRTNQFWWEICVAVERLQNTVVGYEGDGMRRRLRIVENRSAMRADGENEE